MAEGGARTVGPEECLDIGVGSSSARRPILHGLTGIRFFAAFMVLLFHFGAGFAARSGAPTFIVHFLHNGYLGVSLFFMLSGFIITYTYEGKLGTRAQYLDYGIARFSRLYPVYLLALVMALPYAWPDLDIARVASVLLMVQSWTPPSSSFGFSWVMQAWTLSIELFFYICAPLVMLVLGATKVRALWPTAVVLAGAMIVLQVPTIVPGTEDLPFTWQDWLILPMFRMIEFLYGATLSTLFLARRELLVRWSGPVPVTVNLGLILIILATTEAPLAVSAAMALTGLLLAQIAAGDTYLSRFLTLRPLLVLGGASYALYLLQAPVREYLRLIPDQTIGQVLNPFVVTVLSVVVFFVWEEPARKWLRRTLASRMRNR